MLDGSSTSADDLPGDIVIDLVDLSLGDRIAGSEGIRIDEVQGTVSCRVTVPEDAAVGIRFSFEEESAT